MTRPMSAVVIDSGRARVYANSKMRDFTWLQFAILRALWQASPKPIKISKIERDLYGLRPYCDVPTSNVVVRCVCIMRPKLLDLGIVVKPVWGEKAYVATYHPFSSLARRSAA